MLQLSQERPIHEVTVRDIGRLADVNHGFVHTWFGSKAALVAAAGRHLSKQLSQRVGGGGIRSMGLRSPEVAQFFRLVAWLQTEQDAPAVLDEQQRPMIDATVDVLRGLYDVDTATATTLAEIAAAASAGTALVGDTLGLDEDSMTNMWIELLDAFAARRVAHDGTPG